jgi:C4-dicarboxylate-specific signal transduction histidine kinase
VGTVASSAAHELNQPLNVIRMAAFNLKRSIEKDRFDPASALEKLARIDEQIERAARLTGGMKAFSPAAQQEKIPVRPSELVAIALELLAKRFASVDATLAYTPCGVDCQTQGVPTAIQELVFNLVENAVQAYARQGPLQVDLESANSNDLPERVIRVVERVVDNRFELSVTDTAGGIEPSILDHVQVPFFTSAEDGSHAGLGFARCQAIATDLGGSLTLVSHDNGTTATVIFPVTVPVAVTD